MLHTHQLRLMLEGTGLSAEIIDEMCAKNAANNREAQAAWDATPGVLFLQLETAALDNAKVKIAQVEKAMRDGKVTGDEAVERVLVIRQQLQMEQAASDNDASCSSCFVIVGKHERFCGIAPDTDKKTTQHTTSDGSVITLGMPVTDYDAKAGWVARTDHNKALIETNHVPGTCSAWWDVEYAEGTGYTKQFDCSRLTFRSYHTDTESGV